MKQLLTKEDLLTTYKSEYHGKIALSNYEDWFPILASKELAGIVADLMGDGHLQGHPQLRLDYTSKFDKELERFEEQIFKLFGIKGKIRKSTTNNYNTKNLGVNNKPLARVLKSIGVPTGAKVLKRFQIPQWILEDEKVFKKFINRLFSCEGHVGVNGNELVISMYKDERILKDGMNFFGSIKYYLEKYYGIRTTRPFTNCTFNLRKDGVITKPIIIKIKNRDSIIKFSRNIGIEDPEKKQKLKILVEKLK